MFLFAIKFCISNNIFSNEYTKFRITCNVIYSFTNGVSKVTIITKININLFALKIPRGVKTL